METIKKSIITRIIIILSLIMMVFITFSCDSPTKPIIKTKQELYAKLNESIVGNQLDIFIKSFSEYELEMIDYQDESQNIIHFSFSDEKIDRNRFIELFRSDPNVLRVEFEPSTKWRQGELIARLTFIGSQQLDKIIEKYLEFDLRHIDNSMVPYSHEYFSFDHNLIDEYEFVNIFRQEIGERVDLLYNVQGKVYASYSSVVPFDDVLEYLLSFSEYDIKVLSHSQKARLFLLSYDHTFIEPFDFIRLLRKDKHIFLFHFFREWYPGELLISFEDPSVENIIIEFLDDYRNFGFEISCFDGLSNRYILRFDHVLYDEFMMIDMIDSDPRISSVELKRPIYL